ncbi:FAD:protein FMN transferase [Spirosoma humi]
MRTGVNVPLQPFYIQGTTQGTTYVITYYAGQERIKKSSVDSIFSQLDQSLSIYKPYSLISQFNNSERGIETDVHLSKVVRKSLEVCKETNGIFDITVYPLINAWGFGTQKTNTLPDSAYIKSLLPCVGSEKILLDKNRLNKKLPCVKIDVNGIAQGYSVDVIANFLEYSGIQNYLVEVGGEIRVKGRKYPESIPMSIGIETPSENEFEQTDIRKVFSITNGAVTTSGSYRKFRKAGSVQISHIIDPKSGFSAQTNLISVTVYASDAITADGYDNALLAMGLDRSLAFLTTHRHLQAYFIYKKMDGLLADTATTGFYKFLK